MQYEDLKDVFYFKTAYGKSPELYKADRVSKHTWNISCNLDDNSSVWDCDDFICHLNDGSWVIQGEEEDTDKHTEQKQQETPVEVKTIRDEFAMAALQGWIASKPVIGAENLTGSEEHAKIMAKTAYIYADAMMKVRKE